MKIKLFAVAAVFLSSIFIVAGQPPVTEKKCCDIPECKAKSESFAVKLIGMAAFLPPCSDDKDINKRTLDSLQKANQRLYSGFIETMNDLVDFRNSIGNKDRCFSSILPDAYRDNILNWIIYFNDIKNPVKFPSTEFCRGWKKRFEISQGAANIFTNAATYLGSLHGFIAYTFKPSKQNEKESCGGKFRLMAGPSLYMRGNTSYITANARTVFWLKDIGKQTFHVGNINAFGEYFTNFSRFNYAGAGIEIELGPFALNLEGNINTRDGKLGFLTGVVFSNKKL